MNITIPPFILRSVRFRVSLPGVLEAAWWAVLIVGLGLLIVDGLVFYQYGLGQAALPTVLPTRDGVPPEEELIRKAARIIAQKRAAFEVHEPAPSDLPRPFQ